MKPGQIAFARMPDGPVVDGHVLGEQHHAALRGVVGAAAGRALEALDAGEGHDRAPLAVDRGSCSSIWAIACLATRNVPVRLTPMTRSHSSIVDQVDGPAAGDARGVHDAVEPTARGDRRGDERLDRGLVGDVAVAERPALVGVGSSVGA